MNPRLVEWMNDSVEVELQSVPDSRIRHDVAMMDCDTTGNFNFPVRKCTNKPLSSYWGSHIPPFAIRPSQAMR